MYMYTHIGVYVNLMEMTLIDPNVAKINQRFRKENNNYDVTFKTLYR